MTKRKPSMVEHERKLYDLAIANLKQLMDSCYRQMLELEARRSEL